MSETKEHRVDVIGHVPGDVDKEELRAVVDEFEAQLGQLGARTEIGIATREKGGGGLAEALGAGEAQANLQPVPSEHDHDAGNGGQYL